MKKILCLLTSVLLLMLTLTSCDVLVDKLPDQLVDKLPFLKDEEHTHTFANEWSSDEKEHWHAATCEHTEEIADIALHTDDGKDGVCDVCGKVYYTPEKPEDTKPEDTKPDTPATPHAHTFATEWSSDGVEHWHAATCEHTEVIKDIAPHTDSGNDGVCDVCGKTYYTPVIPHEHEFSTEWTSDDNNHWHAATCEHTEELADLAPHTDSGNDGVCDVCGKTYYTPVIPHEHEFSTEWTSDDNNHWHAATCEHTEEIADLASHTDSGNDGVCDTCGKTYYTPVIPHEHEYSTEWTSDDNNHWHAATCEHTEELADLAPHTDSGNDGVCDTCGKTYYTPVIPEPHKHVYSDAWTTDETNHWHAAICGHAEEIADLAPHTDNGNDGVCDTCGKTYYTPHKHSFSGAWTADKNNHWHEAACEHTNEIADLAPHTDSGNDGVCDVCYTTYYVPHKHSFSEAWSSDDNNHWHAATCDHTEEIADLAPHTDNGNDGVCDTCHKAYYIPSITLSTGQVSVSVLGNAVKARFTAGGNGTYVLNLSGEENVKVYIVKGNTEVLIENTYEVSLSAGETVTFMIYRDSAEIEAASVNVTVYKKSGVPVTPEVGL